VEALRERFGKYHVLEKLAQGGMAEVYKVKTVGIAGFEKVQALKRILPNSAREGRFIRSFIDEARIAVELTHRNIVQVFDFGKADGELFMAMELIEGKDLRTAMAQAVSRDTLPPIAVSAYIVGEVAQGLDCSRLVAVGFGSSKPIADNRTPEGKAANRRVVFANAALRGRPIGGAPLDGGGKSAGSVCD
jgi:hypothetical protein